MTLLKFTENEVKERFELFVQNFLSDENNVERTQMSNTRWLVSVPSKDFSVSIVCECIGHFHEVEEWAAVIQETNGEKTNYLLFAEEIEKWASEQRKLKGIQDN